MTRGQLLWRRALAILAWSVVIAGAYAVAHLALIEVGREVIVLHTRTATGELRGTRLWVVDHDGYAWVNGGGQAAWYRRLLENPDVEMTRKGQTRHYRAVPVPGFRTEMHVLLREKYGFADWWVRHFKDPKRAVPVRLEPLEGNVKRAPPKKALQLTRLGSVNSSVQV